MREFALEYTAVSAIFKVILINALITGLWIYRFNFRLTL